MTNGLVFGLMAGLAISVVADVVVFRRLRRRIEELTAPLAVSQDTIRRIGVIWAEVERFMQQERPGQEPAADESAGGIRLPPGCVVKEWRRAARESYVPDGQSTPGFTPPR